MLNKRILLILPVLVLVFPLLAACGGGGTRTGGDTGSPTATTVGGGAQATLVPPKETGMVPAPEATPVIGAIGTGVPGTQGTTGPGTAGDKKVKIRLGTWAGVDEAKELQAVIDKVNAQSNTFQIVSEPQPADYYTKLQTTISGGKAPDLFWLSQEYIPGYAERGALLDVTECLQNSHQPAANLDDYYSAVLQTAQFNGKTYGLPWIAQPVILYYNPKLFKDAGVAEPTPGWTWDDFKNAAAKITDPKKGIYGTAFHAGWPPIHMFIWQAGGEVISEDRTESPIDTPEAIQAEKFYQDIIYNLKYAAPENVIAEQGFAELAKNGKVAMFFGGAGDDLDYAHTKDPKFAIMKAALVPKGPKSRTTFAWTASTVVNAKTSDPRVACDALIALTEGIHHWKVVAPRKSLANKQTIVASVPQKKDSADVIVQAAQDMRSFRVVPQQSEWDTTFWEKFQDPLFHHKGSAEELAKKARPELEAILQGP
jgi:multiple sugar transport system substrate-binding protein